MNGLFSEFLQTYGVNILYTLLTAIAGYLAVALKRLYTKIVNDRTKESVVKTCVKAVEQIYRDLHGEEKLNKCIEAASQMLCEKGITVTEIEMRMLIESAINEMNKHIGDLLRDDVTE